MAPRQAADDAPPNITASVAGESMPDGQGDDQPVASSQVMVSSNMLIGKVSGFRSARPRAEAAR